MRFSKLNLGLIVVLVIAVAFAGCSGTSTAPTTPSGGQGPASGGGQATAAPQGGGGGTAGGSSVTGGSLFGGLSYNWVEYKMTSGSGAEKMTIFFKYEKSGKCTMRFEGGSQVPGMPTELDCSSTGGQARGDPNDVSSDVKFVKVGTEPVTVPAGTFVADKYTATYQGATSTYWMVAGKPLIKMEGGSAEGSATMELNGFA